MSRTFKQLGEDLIAQYGQDSQDTEGACMQVAWAATAALSLSNKLPPGCGDGKTLQTDLVTIGYLKAKEMLHRFNPEKGTLRQFLYRQVLGHIQLVAWKEYTPNDAPRRQRNIQVFSVDDALPGEQYNSIDSELSTSDDYWEERELDAQEQEDTIKSLVGSLEASRRQIICRYYGVLGYDSETLRELAKRFECSVSHMHGQVKSIENELTRRATSTEQMSDIYL